VFTLLGKEVVTLVDRYQEAGSHQVLWDASDYASGVYLLVIKTRNCLRHQKLLLLNPSLPFCDKKL
jgi:hypothetical protein